MKIPPRNIAAFLRAPDAAMRAVLFYGPDGGLVRERAETLMGAVVDDVTDPFRIAEFSAAALRDDPARLADEAAAMALTGGRRVVRIRDAGDGLGAVIEGFFQDAVGDALIIVEAANLPARSSLRKVFEGAKNGAAIACYADEGRDLETLIREVLGGHQVSADGEAMAYLRANLGSDRLISRGELEKLALYAGDGGGVALTDAQACVGDSAAVALEDIAFAAGDGDHRALVRALARAFQEGAAPVAVLRAVGRHFQRLQVAVAAMANGQAPDSAMKSLRPPVFFKRADGFRAQLGRWPADRIASALILLTEAEVSCKTTGLPATAMCGQALLRLAQSVRGRSRSA